MKLGNTLCSLTAPGARVAMCDLGSSTGRSGSAAPSGLSVTSAVTAEADAGFWDGISSLGVRMSPLHATVLSRRLLVDSLALGENDGILSPRVSPASGVE